MAYFSRVVGDVQQMVDIFIQDATVSTGSGFPNLEISTFSSYYHRSDMTSTSSVTMVSTGTLGTWASGQFLQINSTFMRGWYQFCCPDDMFVNGSTVALHMYGHPSIAPAPVVFDITRFNPQSATVNANRVGVSSFGLQVGVSTFDSRVGVSSFNSRVGVSSFDLPVGVSSFGLRVGVSSMNIAVDVSSLNGDSGAAGNWANAFNDAPGDVPWTNILEQGAAVSTSISSLRLRDNGFNFANDALVGATITIFDEQLGYWQSRIISDYDRAATTVYFDSLVSTSSGPWNYKVWGTAHSSSTNPYYANLTRIYGDGAITTAAGTLGVGRVGVSSFNLQVGVSTFNSRVGVSSFDLPVGVSSFNSRVGVSSFNLPVGVSSQQVAVDVTSFIGSAGVFTAADSSVAFSSVFFSSVPVSVGRVGVSSFDLPVGVSSFGIPVGVSTIQVGVSTSWFSGGTVVTSVAGVLASHVTSMRVAVDRQIADAFLGRNVSSGGDGVRTVSEALYLLRNRSESIGGTLTVYTTDDTVTSWNATVSTASGNPVVGIDPD